MSSFSFLKKVYFYYGTECFLIDTHLKNILPHQKHYQILHSEISLDSLYRLLFTVQLIQMTTHFVIKNPIWLEKPSSKSELNVINEILNNLQHTNFTLIICQYKSIDKNNPIIETIINKSEHKIFNKFNDWENNKILAWINNQAKSYKKTLEQDASKALLSMNGNQLQSIDKQLKLLSIYAINKPLITLQDVLKICSDTQVQIFQLNEALASNQLNKIFYLISRLLESGKDPIFLLNTFYTTYLFYLKILLLKEENYQLETIAKKISKHPYYVKQILEKIKNHYSLKKLKIAISILSKTDIAIKKGAKLEEPALKDSLLALQQLFSCSSPK